MAQITVTPLRDELDFGSRVAGVSLEVLQDEAIRQQLRNLFEDRGLLVFEGLEPSQKMQVELSNVFGPLKDHPVPAVDRVDQEMMPGVIDMKHDLDNAGIWEIDGKQLSSWLPWHFDHCYNNELNRAGVLRAVDIPPEGEGGLTGFADGLQLYRDLSPELREKIEGLDVLYTLDMRYTEMRFGRPSSFREIRPMKGHIDMLDYARSLPRAIHPAVWSRDDGGKVFHVSPWMAVGIENREDPEGDKLLDAVCHEIRDKAKAYFHKWKHTDMIIWDNWRMLHCVGGHNPKISRRMQRTTIKGDYGLGRFENNAKGHRIQAETEV
jgi:taurine dioxygenase